MKKAFSFAFISILLTGLNQEVASGCPFAWHRRAAEVPRTSVRVIHGTRTVEYRRTTVPAVAEQLPQPVATPRTVDGVLPRLLTAPDPAQMINPLAPPEYGSGRNLVVYTERDPYRTDNENKRRLQPEGLRLLTIRPLW